LCKNRGDFGTDYIAWPILCRMCFAALVRNLCDCRWLSRLQNIRYSMHATQSAVATAPGPPPPVTCLTRLDASVSLDKGTVIYAKANAVTNFPATIKTSWYNKSISHYRTITWHEVILLNPRDPADRQEIYRLFWNFNPLNAELSPICHLLALLGAHHILHVSRIRVKLHNPLYQGPSTDYFLGNIYLVDTPAYCFFNMHFYTFPKSNYKKRLLASSCPSVRSQGNLGSLWTNFREIVNSVIMLQICWPISSSFKIGQIQQALYKKTCVYLFSWFL
jgi:hypothetical protein